jgi:hypothetical protein
VQKSKGGRIITAADKLSITDLIGRGAIEGYD